MSERIVHETGIPVEGWMEAYEYPLPLTERPHEVDVRWDDFVEDCVGTSIDGVHDLIRQRFQSVSPELVPLTDLVLDFTLFSVVVYCGTPLLWLENTAGGQRDFIYLPPAVGVDEVRAALKPYQLDAHALLVELFVFFGGLGDRWPWGAPRFAGCRQFGKLVIEPATAAIEVGFPCLSAAKVNERRRLYAPWFGGVAVFHGEDGLLWHIGTNGTICEYEDGDDDDVGCFDSLAAMIDALVQARKPDHLFYGGFYGLPGSKPVR